MKSKTHMKLGDICEINPKPLAIDDDAEVSFVAMADVTEDGRIRTDTGRRYRDVKRGFTCFGEGDVLFAKITPCMENGKGALATGLTNGVGCGSTEFHVLRPDKNLVDGKWLYYLTARPSFRATAQRHMTGSAGQKRVPKSFLENYEVRLPDLETQKHQVAILDRLKKILELRVKELAALDELVKARFVEMFGDYKHNDHEFEMRPGSELFKFSSGKFLPEEKRLADGFPVYGGNGIAWHTDQFLVDYPTIVIGRVGAFCGNIHVIFTPAWITDNAIYIKEQKTDKLELTFLSELMTVMDFHQYADLSGQPKITQRPLETMMYLLPPKELQERYASFVARVERLKAAIQRSLEEAQRLFDSQLQEHFG